MNQKVFETPSLNHSTRGIDLESNDLNTWIDFFYERANSDLIFKAVLKHPAFSTALSAAVIGSKWKHFSEFMPWFLCQAAAKVSSNLKRTYICKPAFEELGMGIPEDIHPYQFQECLKLAGVTKSATHLAPIHIVRDFLFGADREDNSIFGLCAGLEIIANDNIEFLFNALAYNAHLRKQLSETEFFKIHRVNEQGHIELTIGNFLRFSPLREDRLKFLEGFDKAIEFWFHFWNGGAIEMTFQTKGFASMGTPA
jgi:hypothetical protein